MTENLQKQVHIYSLDTSAFYNDEEQKIHRKLMKSYNYRNKLKQTKGIPKVRVRYVTDRINRLKSKLKSLIVSNEESRQLNRNSLKDNNIISVFESTLTRTLEIPEDTLTDEIFVIRAFYFDVLQDLINNGFIHNGEKYIYFSSSAGQIRTKKGVWIKESSWEKYKYSLTCGLTTEDINKQGGSNINKYLAYIALTNGATAEWKDFDIHRTIVVDDLETDVNGIVDYIDRDTYEIERKRMDIPIEHTDGCGMILPTVSKKSFMVRLPFVKGLLVPFDYRAFVNEYDGNTKIKDIYGKEWDIIDDDIHIIFTKSQFKMHGYYESWDDYKNKFIKYDCQAAKLNEEEDQFPEAKLNYQMLQTLTDITDDELEELSESTVDDILEIGSDKDTMLRLLGATDNNKYKNHFQQALNLYPELLNDVHAKNVIKDVKKSLVKNAKSGKLNISGKYTYLCPDLFAFCERLFLGVENPKGLLANEEVYCGLFDEGKLDLLRSPHLYREHGVRSNVKDKSKSKWFITNGVYTSIHDTISKMLQFDNDGDKALVVGDETFVSIAERNMEGIVPLYYEMANAEPEMINGKNIYSGLINAFKANIGEISNNISKVWNSDDIDLNVVKWLCMENNFVIDYAKTLFKPTRPKHIDDKIKSYIKNKLPHFFIYAKNKEERNVEEVNDSTVNKLDYIIPDKRIYFRKVAGQFDHKMLMSNPRVRNNKKIVERYAYLVKRKKRYMNQVEKVKDDREIYFHTLLKEELLKINDNATYVVDVLVKHLYEEKPNNSKTQLWSSFGNILVRNLKHNINNADECIDCCTKFIGYDSKQIRCDKCQEKYRKKMDRVRKRTR